MKTYYIQQRIQLIGNEYRVHEANSDGEQGELVAYARQKIFAFKEKFTFYADESMEKVAFELRARQVIDLGARYDIRDAKGKIIGTIGKAFTASLLRSTWNIYKNSDDVEPLIVARERSKNLAIWRRVWEILPYIGELPFFLKYHFDFVDPKSEKMLATYNKTTILRDYYKLSAEDTITDKVDWRVLVAAGVMMDAMQSR